MNWTRLSKIFSLIAAGIGALGFLGWVCGIDSLKRIHPALVTMKANTALCLVLAGLAVYLIQEEGRRGLKWHLARGFAVVIAIVGLLTFAEHIFGVDFGIDQALFAESVAEAGQSLQGRMGPASAVNFLILGTALLLLDFRTRRGGWPSQWCFVTGIGITFLIFLGYFYGLGRLGPLAHYVSIALHTVVAFLLLFSGALLARPERGIVGIFFSDSIGAIAARRMLPVALLVPALLGWASVAGQDAGWFDAATATALFATAVVVIFAIMILQTSRQLERAGEARYQLAAIVESSEDAIVSKNLNGIVTSWNQGAEKLFGYTAAEMVGQPIVRIIPPERHQEETMILRRLQNGERIHHYETVRMSKDGRLIDVSLTISPMHAATGRIIGASKIARDISERRQTEEKLRQARDAAEAANRAKDDFLAALSHELRTPLTPVLMLATDLEHSEDIPSELRADFATIRQNVELEARLIDDLLDLTRITQGKLALRFAKVDSHKLLRHALDILRNEIQAKKLTVTFDLAADECQVSADAVRLQQVFWNILKNAVKFNEHHGIITIRSWNETDRLRIAVSDSGLGITAEEMPRIFDAFAQGSEASEPRFGGLGLGLSISALLVREHGGRIWAESPGRRQGATLQLELPLAPAVTAGNGASPLEKTVESRAARILLVEDHDSTRQTLERLLSRRGHTVESVNSIAKAVEVARRGQIDLIISDLGLPDGHGTDLLHALRPECHLPAIALSGYGMKSDIEGSHAAGFDEHFTKPVDISRLQQAIQRLIS